MKFKRKGNAEIEVPYFKRDEDGESCSRYCIDEMLFNSRLTLAELVRRNNELFPNHQTTVPNISNKLRRGSLGDYELSQYAYAMGYKLVIVPTDVEPTQVVQDTPALFEELIDLGFVATSTPHFSNVYIAGRRVVEASNYINEFVSKPDIKATDELRMFLQVEKQFGVKIQPLKMK